MDLDINKIYHQYITKIVIFSLFVHKSKIRQSNFYKLSVISFVNKRLPWKINLSIDTGVELDKDDERDLIIDTLINDVETDYLSVVEASFTTPLKNTTIKIDLSKIEKYKKFLYD